MSGTPTDEELLASIQRKDMNAFAALYDRHRALAYALALRIVANPSDAEDVTQEAYLNVWRASGTYQPGQSSVRSWLLSIVHHRAIDRIRSRQSRPMLAPVEDSLEIPDTVDVWRQVSDRLTGEDVRRALSDLPDEQRTTIELAFFNGFTHVQIAQMMEVPLGTVKGRMRIGLRKLKSTFEDSMTEVATE